MKKFLQLIIFFILLLKNELLFAQWSTDPNNTLIVGYGLDPQICSDSTGGCYITYGAGYPAKLFLHRFNKYGYQPWGDRKEITGELDEQNNAKIIDDGECGIIISYGDRVLYNTYRLRVQKVDSIGNFIWGPNGQKVSLVDTSQSVGIH